MPQTARELWLAASAILVITALYLLTAFRLGGIPAASDFFGHSLGILGFLLMLMTETLYSRRKRSQRARWGKMSQWLQFHIFTGLVGPWLVFLHTAFKFNGLAGIVMLLTALIVLSGFVGRYIYTAVPRSADGAILEAAELAEEMEQVESGIARWLEEHPEMEGILRPLLEQARGSGGALTLVMLRAPQEWAARLRWYAVRRRAAAPLAQVRQLEQAARRRRNLGRQIASLTLARRMLGLWHTIHVPIGVALFTTAVIHIVAAIYYATLLR
jgi:hypothetical protein